MEKITIIISNPDINYIESQLLECNNITKNIVISFSDINNMQKDLISVIDKHHFYNVILAPFHKNDEIEYNPLKSQDITVFWNNISRISAVNSIINNDIDFKIKPSWFLFIDGNEIPNFFLFSKFFNDEKIELNNDFCHIFKNNIILIPSHIFTSDLEISKILMKDNERLESANTMKTNNFTRIYPDIFFIIS